MAESDRPLGGVPAVGGGLGIVMTSISALPSVTTPNSGGERGHCLGPVGVALGDVAPAPGRAQGHRASAGVRSTSTVVPYKRANFRRLRGCGTGPPACSHLDTWVDVTPTIRATASWVRPRLWRSRRSVVSIPASDHVTRKWDPTTCRRLVTMPFLGIATRKPKNWRNPSPSSERLPHRTKRVVNPKCPTSSSG